MNRFNWILLILVFGVVIVVGYLLLTPRNAGANLDHHHDCDEEEDCPTPKPTKTPKPTATPTVKPTATPTPTPEVFHYTCNDDNQCVKVEGKGDSTCEENWDCQPEETPTPTPTVTPTPTPESTPDPWDCSKDHSCKQEITTPVCTDSRPASLPANPHVYRKGPDAIIKWFPTAGDKVNIYYKVVGSPTWQFSLADQPNNGYVQIHDLDSLDITFGIQQEQGCAGGDIIGATIVDGATQGWTLFR